MLQRTQIYLDPEEHRRLKTEAAERGISLAEYLRQIVAQRAARAGEQATYGDSPYEELIGIVHGGLPSGENR